MLKKARENKGLGTREVARLLQIDAALISKFESGQRQPTKKQLHQLAELYAISLDALTLLWLTEKILREISGEPLGLQALQAAEKQLNPEPQKPQNSAIDALLEEMNALKNKMENLRDNQ